MKKRIIINEKNYLADNVGLKGIVSIYDKNHNLVSKNHNMIVMDGRKFLLNLFKIATGISFTNSDEVNDYPQSCNLYFNFGYLGQGSPRTAYNLTYSMVTGNNSAIHSEKVSSAVLINSENTLGLSFTATIKGSEEFQRFDEIFLSLKTDTTDYLFSRVSMDPVFLGTDGEYTIQYNIYF